MKLEKWDKLVATCDKILNMDPNNAKAHYRKVIGIILLIFLGLKNKMEYEQAYNIISKYLSEQKNNLDKQELGIF